MNTTLRNVLGAASLTVLLLGCESQPHAKPAVSQNPALRKIQTPAGGDAADADRAALARFVGVWSFQGWSTGAGGEKHQASGEAAGLIDSEHFVALHLRTTSGQMSGRTSRKAGTLLMASEPGIGVTLTAWGDSSPSVNRLVGRAEGNGSAFVFEESATPGGVHRLSLNISFETDDRWKAEIRDTSESGQPVIASYTFSRTSK